MTLSCVSGLFRAVSVVPLVLTLMLKKFLCRGTIAERLSKVRTKVSIHDKSIKVIIN